MKIILYFVFVEICCHVIFLNFLSLENEMLKTCLLIIFEVNVVNQSICGREL